MTTMTTMTVPENVIRAVKAMLEPFVDVSTDDVAGMIEHAREGKPAFSGEMLTLKEAAARLNVSLPTIYAMINSGRLTAVPLKPEARRKVWRIPGSALQELADGQAAYVEKRRAALEAGAGKCGVGMALV